MPRLKTCTCSRCAHRWQDFPGGFARVTQPKSPNDSGGCPKCGSLYWTEADAAS